MLIAIDAYAIGQQLREPQTMCRKSIVTGVLNFQRDHPLAGQEFEFVKRCRTWCHDRVHFVDRAGELASVPAEWTDVVAADAFVMVAAGRSPFHVGGLLELSELVVRLRAGG